MTKKRFSDLEEREIRHAFFHKGISPKSILRTWGMSETMLRRIVGGPLSRKDKGIEKVYT